MSLRRISPLESRVGKQLFTQDVPAHNTSRTPVPDGEGHSLCDRGNRQKDAGAI
jgi:hypothetical protein